MAAADCHVTLRASTGVARPLILRITIAGAFPALNWVLAQVWSPYTNIPRASICIEDLDTTVKRKFVSHR
jgi:hypothetical protein